MENLPPYPRDAIAIVGSACRFAGGVNSPSKLWDLLRSPRDLLSEIPLSRFNADKFYNPNSANSGTSNVRHSYLLEEDHRVFDAEFFGIKGTEATAMDPQQRILLETAYEALEAAGMPLEQIRGTNLGVYVGLMIEEYSQILGIDTQNIPTYFASGTARNNVSNRISHIFDLNGPSMTIDTACSSSLVALHQAIHGLRAGEMDSALVAGANLILSPEQYIVSSKLKMLSPSGRSRMWDAKADGYGRGDGFTVVVVKTLARAQADGDSIECIIRETGVNQDGHTKGLTMPNPKAQADLIESTYRRAGLDLDKTQDRPQFFEAHGTGTPAGDPAESEAINTVFFDNHRHAIIPTDAEVDELTYQPLLVGSAKTVLGHTEGTAGLLGIMKASLALQHEAIPPNMLLDELSPTVQPFCTHLRIPQELHDWPNVSACVRRASVNSFGFGGTNAHAILESYADPAPSLPADDTEDQQRFIMMLPFTFSAASKSSLRRNLAAHVSYLRNDNPSVNVRDLSWTLHTRRSHFAVRKFIMASSTDSLVTRLEEAVVEQEEEEEEESRTAAAPLAHVPLNGGIGGGGGCLAIFTGQGAQWPQMGRYLLETSPMFATCFETLQSSVDEMMATLPALSSAPKWSLRGQLVCDDDKSGFDASRSQPLCTAIQIALVQVLRAAGVSFSAVVGHSSGEIAAAYAAGYLSAEDAIRVAYLRGFFLSSCSSSSSSSLSQPGSMIAVGTSAEDAEQLCGLPGLRGRVGVAAVNSPTSVTLAGDLDAVVDVEEIMEDEGKFARRLRVDKAYHFEKHMKPVANAYVQALRELRIRVKDPTLQQQHREKNTPPSPPSPPCPPVWVSSVKAGRMDSGLGIDDIDNLGHSYWRDNMVSPVLFSDAMKCAVQALGPFDVMVEVGPHPALKTPVRDTVDALSLNTLTACRYVPTLVRGKNDAEALAASLGAIWECGRTINFEAIAAAGGSPFSYPPSSSSITEGVTEKKRRRRAPKVVKNLPSYQWNHNRIFWHESRRSRAWRLGSGSGSNKVHHPLLGTSCEDEAEGELRFRNHLHPRDLNWLVDHQIQGQVVLPGSVYISACLEAILGAASSLPSLPPPDKVRLVQLSNIVIRKPLVFSLDEASSSEYGGADVLLSIKIHRGKHEDGDDDDDDGRIEASFQFSSSPDSARESTVLTENCSGEIAIICAAPEDDLGAAADGGQTILPPPEHDSNIYATSLSLEPSTFYDWARGLGYGYEGHFRGLSDIRRKMYRSTGRLRTSSSSSSPFIIHPATLDLAIQGVLLAYSCPGDGRLSTLHMPTRIDHISFDAAACKKEISGSDLFFSSSVAPSVSLIGQVDIHTGLGGRTLVQMEGLHATPVVPPLAENDAKMVFQMVLKPEMPSSPVVTKRQQGRSFDEERLLGVQAERVASFYLRRLRHLYPPGPSRHGLQWHHRRLLKYVDNCVARFDNGTHPYSQQEWLHDTDVDVNDIVQRLPDVVDFKLMQAAGTALPQAIRDGGETNMWEVLTRDGMLSEYYRSGVGIPEYLGAMADTVAHLSHRFAHMDILEVGAGTGAATAAVLDKLQGSFRSYTFTDVSSTFFPAASTQFSEWASQMRFRVLDIEKQPNKDGETLGKGDDQGEGEEEEEEEKGRLFDVVIASLALHATRNLAQSLANIRQRLRPGGYLFLVELTETDSPRVGLMFGGFPDWWLGTRQDQRHLSPCVSVETWRHLLRETRTDLGGFASEMDTIVLADPELRHPLSVMVCQAVDDRVQLLRNPLSVDMVPQLGREALTVIAPRGLRWSSIDFHDSLARHYRAIHWVHSLEDLVAATTAKQHQQPINLPAAGTVVCLLDAGADDDPLLPPVFERLSEAGLDAIKTIIRLSKTILWVSRGCLDSRPHANMFRGLARSAKLEMSNVCVQTLNLPARDFELDWRVVAQSLIRLEAFGVWEEKEEKGAYSLMGRLNNLLEQREPEVFIRHDGVSCVPRLLQDKVRNNRYNSGRRFIDQRVSVNDKHRFRLIQQDTQNGKSCTVAMEKKMHHHLSCHLGFSHSGGVLVRVAYSLLKALPLGPRHRGFLSVGQVMESGGQHVLVVSDSLQSHIHAPLGWTLPISKNSTDQQKHRMLATMQAQLVSQTVIKSAATEMMRHLVVLNPDELMGRVLSRCAEKEGIDLLLLTTKKPTNYRRGWTYIHPRSSRSTIHRILPRQHFTFVDMSPEQDKDGCEPAAARAIVQNLPPGCTRAASPLNQDVTSLGLDFTDPRRLRCVADYLQAAYAAAACEATTQSELTVGNYWSVSSASSSFPEILDLDSFTSTQQPKSTKKRPIRRHQEQAIISWLALKQVRVPVQPASSDVEFRPDRTYWLVGLSGGLGPGLCEFIASKGAAYIAISSRRPKLDASWVDEMAKVRGCTVRVFNNDVTDRESLRRVHREMQLTMPPIAGVVQGAMVLRDAVLPDLTYSALNETLAPKVQGSRNLDELFSSPSSSSSSSVTSSPPPLDFLIFLSSMAYTAGNRGQSAYSAANAYMASLAADRRRRGLAGFVVNLGAVVGEGYVTRELALGAQSALWKSGFDFLSEQAFHELFSEAVLAGGARLPSECRCSCEKKVGQDDEDELNADDNVEISAGLRVGQTSGVSFADNPIFQHQMATKPLDGEDSSSSNGGSGAAERWQKRVTKAHVLEAHSDEQRLSVIRDGLLNKLEAVLGVQINDRSSALRLSPDQLGVDSLVAVEIQSWFVKELGVDLSAMKIINSSSLDELVRAAKDAFVLLHDHNTSNDEIPSGDDEDTTSTVISTTDSTTTTSSTVASTSTLPHLASSSGGSLTEEEFKSPTTASVVEKSPSSIAAGTPGESSPILSSSVTKPSSFSFSSPRAAALSNTQFERSVPMSFSQKRFWFLRAAVENKTVFNVTTVVRLEAGRHPLDHTKLAGALVAVGQRHEAIRTAFYVDEVTRQPMQGILPFASLDLECNTISGHEDEAEDQIQRAIEAVQNHEYDLTTGKTVRLVLLSSKRRWEDDDSHVLILGYHHIALDGMSNQIFFSDLERAYEGRLGIEETSLLLQYPDFAQRQVQNLERGAWDHHLRYWRGQFPSTRLPPFLALLDLCRHTRRPENTRYESHSVKIHLDATLNARIDMAARHFRVSPYHVYLAVFRVLLFRHAHTQQQANEEEGEEDICIGVADGNRRDVDVLRSLGLFLNLVPLRFRGLSSSPSLSSSFSSVLQDVKTTSDAGFTHARVPFDVLLSQLDVPRSSSHSPLFQAFFNYQPNISDMRSSFCGCAATGELVAGGETGYDVSLDVVDSKTRENTLNLSVNAGLYRQQDAWVLVRSYLSLLQGVVATLDSSSSSSSMIPMPASTSSSSSSMKTMPLHLQEDIDAAVALGRGPEEQMRETDDGGHDGWSSSTTICHRIEHMATMFANHVAMTDGNGLQLTYQEMRLRVEAISMEIIRNFGGMVKRGDPVAIFMSPGPDWVCSFLGVLFAGGCCVPLDHRLGMRRLRLMIEDCKPRVILVDREEADEDRAILESTGAILMNVSSIIGISPSSENSELPSSVSPTAAPLRRRLPLPRAEDAAIIAYTSASTGVPKGSVIRHASYRNFCQFAPSRWGMKPGVEENVVLQQSSYAFDLSIGQILVCLCYGGKLVVPPDEQRRDPSAICHLIIQERVTFTIATPTEYFAWLRHDTTATTGPRRLLAQSSSHWRTAITAGEAATKRLVQAFGPLNLTLINVYGPSETTIGCADQILLHPSSNSSTCYPSSSYTSYGVGEDTCHHVDDDASALSVLPNYAIYIVDVNFNPVPTGMPGQVLIGGAGVADGYLNRDESNRQAFIHNRYASPFLTSNGWVSAHVSGDRGRLDSEARLELLGRIQGSTQVKIGGVRMDLQDIETTLVASSSRIQQAIVSRRVSSDEEAEFLVAFLVLVKDDDNSHHLRGEGQKVAGGSLNGDDFNHPVGDSDETFLQRVIRNLPLPDIMKPSIAMSVKTLPITMSNKIDRRAVDSLPIVTQNHHSSTALDNKETPWNENQQSNPPPTHTDELKSKLKLLWQEALPKDIVQHATTSNSNYRDGDDADFFLSGGNSLTLLTLQALIQERLNISVSIMDLFRSSTLGTMADALRKRLVIHDGGDSAGSSLPLTPSATTTVVVPEEEEEEEEEEEGAIDWEEELAFPDGLFPSSSPAPSSPSSPSFSDLNQMINTVGESHVHTHPSTPKHLSDGVIIVLTGATGFLGQRILQQLVLSDQVATIHCIAVRREKDSFLSSSNYNNNNNNNPFFTHPKTRIHHGNLRSAPYLGLTASTASHIFSSASAVIHCGANVSFLEPYRTLRHTNLASTKTLAKLCLTLGRGTPFHYISTASVTQLTRARTWGPESVADFPPPTSDTQRKLNGFGYKATKWASEVFLEHAAAASAASAVPKEEGHGRGGRTRGGEGRWNVTIHRPTSITGQGAHDTDLMGSVMRFARQAKAVPEAVDWKGNLDFVDVGTVAERVVAQVLFESSSLSEQEAAAAAAVADADADAGNGQRRGVRYLYESGDDIISVEDIGKYIEGQTGEAPVVLPFREWVEALGRQGMNPFLVEYLYRVQGDTELLLFPNLVN